MSNQLVTSRSRSRVNENARERIKQAARARVKEAARATVKSRANASVKASAKATAKASVKPSAKATARKTRRALDTNKIKAKLQALLEKYERAYELVQQKMAECEKNLKQLDEYMKREVRAKEEYDVYAERYRAILEGAGTRF
jgi:tRNA U34 5-carboxymethylaminomethyl modifying enzyme MnmG/GidA